MYRSNQPWYQDFGTEFGLDEANGEADGWLSLPVDRSMDSALPPAGITTIEPTAMLWTSHSNIPFQFSIGHSHIASPHQTAFQEDDTEWFSILADASSQAAADTPNSFHNRVRQTTLPRTQSSSKTVPEETSTENVPPGRRADSGIGNFEDAPDFSNPAHDMQSLFDQDAYERRFEDDFFHADQIEDHVEEPQHTGSLQYHLIRTRSRTNCRNPHPEDTKKIEVCPLCPNKRFTGVWAHRNLTRHMESVHAPCASSDGLRQIRCGFGGCDRTFRREDARLVHERRSHPELGRPPAAKRKRSDDL